MKQKWVGNGATKLELVTAQTSRRNTDWFKWIQEIYQTALWHEEWLTLDIPEILLLHTAVYTNPEIIPVAGCHQVIFSWEVQTKY